MEKFSFSLELVEFLTFEQSSVDIRGSLQRGESREQKRVAGQVANALHVAYREAVALQRSTVELSKFAGIIAQKAKPRGTKDMLIKAKVPAAFIEEMASRSPGSANLDEILNRFEYARKEIDKYVSSLGESGFAFSIFDSEYFDLREQAAALKGLTKEVRGTGARSAVAQTAGRPRKLDMAEANVVENLAKSFENLAARFSKMLGNLKSMAAKIDTAISYASGLDSKNVQGALKRLQDSIGSAVLNLSSIVSKYERG